MSIDETGQSTQALEENSPQPENKNMRQVPIDPESFYVLRGASILTIVSLLKSKIPCEYVDVVQEVQNQLGNTQKVEMYQDPQSKQAEVPPSAATEEGLVEGGA